MNQVETATFESLVNEAFRDPVESIIENEPTREISTVRIGIAKRAIYSIVNEYRKVTSFPETMSYYRIAHSDNKKIDKKMKYIEQCEEAIEDNLDGGYLIPKDLDRLNSQLYLDIKESSKDIYLLKNTKVTSVDLNKRDRGEIDWTPGSLFKIR